MLLFRSVKVMKGQAWSEIVTYYGVLGGKDISWKWQKSRGWILISDKIDFKTKAIKKDKGHLMIKGSIQGEDTILNNIYVPNIGAPFM